MRGAQALQAVGLARWPVSGRPGVIAAGGVPGTPVKSVPLELDALGL
jgi:hypothetical protein